MAQTIDRTRLARVEDLYLTGHSEREIQRVCSAEFQCTRRAVRKYLKIIRDRLAEQVRGADPDATRARIEGMLLSAYQAAHAGGMNGPDAKGMVQAAKALGDLHGVNAPRKIEHSGSIGVPNYDDLQRRLAAVVARDSASADPVAVDGVESAGSGDAGEGPR